MLSFFRAILLALAVALGALPAAAQDMAAPLAALVGDDYQAKGEAIEALAKAGGPRAAAALKALSEGRLFQRRSDKLVVIGQTSSGGALTDAATGAAAGSAGDRELDAANLNNRLRRQLSGLLGSLTLSVGTPAERKAAAESLFKQRDAAGLAALTTALAQEKDAGVRRAMEIARAAIVLASDAPEAERVAAAATVGTRTDREALGLLLSVANGAPPAVAEAARTNAAAIQRHLAMLDYAQNLYYGLSLGAVLLLAAVGLAVTFGVMGVINMAHGEMVMLGAYTTFVVQEICRTAAPQLLDYALFIALPAAFLVTAAAGAILERSVIRWLYGRPLETLLATWGLSLMIQQAVRSIFGPTNREVSNPSWMSGAVDFYGLTLTWSRLWIIVFAIMVFVLLLVVLRRTAFGLQMRAVTQNRPMASSMGIRTHRVDMLTFALGSGVAGIAGVALSQIDNVSPNLGQSYIIDSFMVVVFGGVGNLWGTLAGALTLGVANKLLEPVAGAVLGKIIILVLIILFIQRRPRGLFALRGRAVEA
ncbi:amino acid/amide ABC transporter membrane protein 1 (HAAT family) [Stella humosa]|uniref:Amino acid/amide ABC transporter membrane protein 1 (HAAT family) n=1 Tax=Stella humosa TaxID=94 RepID=A0A3N1KYZ4_9PROT|nr:urea ABC transporter permease subunit UrtB [Stella humosa]ROP83860.1 amino acid/amide ABC transporter membrane protein 1 (HAAT family) [Stella humosa]BBK32878.1 branched-chain amino acid ABC transporter permease [Stella humosa]